MKLYLIAAVTISVSCVYLGILGLKGKNRKPSRRLFFLMCCSMAWFLFCAGLSVASAAKKDVVLWYRLSALGFAPFYAFNLHFYISLLRDVPFKPRDLLAYIPVPFVLVATMVSRSLFDDFLLMGGHWRFFPAYTSIWFWIYFIYYFPYTASTIPILLRRYKKSGRRRDRMQAVLISIFTAVTLLVGSSTDFLLPGFEIYTLPPLGPLIVGVYIFGLWAVVMRYGFMEPSPAFVADEILDNIHEMVFLLDSSLRIVQLNRWSRKVLGDSGKLHNTLPRFPEITTTPEQIEADFDSLNRSESGYSFAHIEYTASPLPVITDSYCARIKDSFADTVGFLVISRQNRDLEEFIRRFRITRREMNVLSMAMEGKSGHEIAGELGITERTVETHLGNIYNKTGAKNRIELFSLAGRYGLILQIKRAN